METGNNTSANSLGTNNASSNTLESSYLIINLRYDGLRMLESDKDRKEIRQIFSVNWLASKNPGYLVDECEKFFNEKNLDVAKAEGILWIFSFSKFCLIPDILYHQGNGEALLNQTSRLEAGEHIFSDFWTRRDVVGIYALPEKLLRYIQSKNQNSTMAQNGFAINALFNLQPMQDDFCYLQVSKAFAELFIAQKGKVIFYNQFAHDVKEDLLYYILSTAEQNKILAPEITLYVSGEIEKGDGLYSLLSKYIGSVNEVKLPANYNASRSLTTHQLRKSVNLLASL